MQGQGSFGPTPPLYTPAPSYPPQQQQWGHGYGHPQQMPPQSWSQGPAPVPLAFPAPISDRIVPAGLEGASPAVGWFLGLLAGGAALATTFFLPRFAHALPRLVGAHLWQGIAVLAFLFAGYGAASWTRSSRGGAVAAIAITGTVYAAAYFGLLFRVSHHLVHSGMYGAEALGIALGAGLFGIMLGRRRPG